MAFSFSESSRGVGVKLVDISDKPVEANVIRNGVQVPRIDLREDLIADFVADERLDDRVTQPRVVFQSIKVGARVPRGTTVNVTLSSKFLLGVNLVSGAHMGLANNTIGEVGELFLQDEAVSKALQGAKTPADLRPEERGAIEEAAAKNGLEIIETQAGQDFEALFVTLQAAQAFG